MNIRLLQELNTKLDPVIKFGYYDEEDRPPYGKLALGGAALGAGGYGAYKLHQAVRGRQAAVPGTTYRAATSTVAHDAFSPTMSYIKGSITDAGQSIKNAAEGLPGKAGDLAKGASRLGRQGVAGAKAGYTSAKRVIGNEGLGALGRSSALRGAAGRRVWQAIEQAFKHTLSEKMQQLIELNARLDNLVSL